MVADNHRRVLYVTSSIDELFRGISIVTPHNFTRINPFSKFFYCQNQETISNKTVTTGPTTP